MSALDRIGWRVSNVCNTNTESACPFGDIFDLNHTDRVVAAWCRRSRSRNYGRSFDRKMIGKNWMQGFSRSNHSIRRNRYKQSIFKCNYRLRVVRCTHSTRPCDSIRRGYYSNIMSGTRLWRSTPRLNMSFLSGFIRNILRFLEKKDEFWMFLASSFLLFSPFLYIFFVFFLKTNRKIERKEGSSSPPK